MPARILLVLCFMAAYLEGCFGILIIGDVNHTVERPVIARKTIYMSPAKNGLTPLSQLRQVWGDPDSITTLPGVQRWTYRMDKLRWHGFVLWLLIPIPVAVPFGYEHMTFSIEDGKVSKAAYVHAYPKSLAYCGLWVTKVPTPWICGVANQSVTRQPQKVVPAAR